MAAHTHRRLAALMALVLWPALVSIAGAQQPSRQTPIFLWGIQRTGVHDLAVEAAVKQRLQQLGEVVLPMPAQAAAASCSGPACGLALRDNTELTAAQVLGGNIETADNGDWRGRLWWVDVASGKVVSRPWQCRGCSLVSLLPREAALLLAAAPTAPADAPEAVSDCSARPAEPSVLFAPASPASEPMRTAFEQGVRLSLLATRGARVPLPALAAELHKALLQMGLRASLATPSTTAPAAPPATSEATLEVELASSPGNRRGTVEEISLSLRAQGRERQLRFYCPAKGCQTQLPRSLRLNLGVLLDSGDPPVVATIVVPESSRCPIPPIGGVRVASLQDPGLPAVGPGTSPPPAPAVETQPAVAAQPAAGDASGPKKCVQPMSKKTQLLIAGGVIGVAGLLGLIPSAWALNRDIANGETCDHLGKAVPCVLPTKGGYISGFILSGIGIAAGAVLLTLSAGAKPIQKVEKCVN